MLRFWHLIEILLFKCYNYFIQGALVNMDKIQDISTYLISSNMVGTSDAVDAVEYCHFVILPLILTN